MIIFASIAMQKESNAAMGSTVKPHAARACGGFFLIYQIEATFMTMLHPPCFVEGSGINLWKVHNCILHAVIPFGKDMLNFL